MIRTTSLAAIGVVVVGTASAPALAKAIYSPTSGVICDQRLQRCYDQLGLSLGYTKEYFGAFAEQRALADLGGRRPPRQFDLSNGAFCSVDQRLCWRDGRNATQIADGLTRDLFGAMPPAPAPKPMPVPTPGPMPGPVPMPPAGLLYPAPGTICDPVYKLCYTRQGISPQLSAANFGPAGMQSAMLATQQGLQRQFLLSNGTFCDVSVPACWSDGMARRLPAPGVSSQLFGFNPGGGGNANISTASVCRLQRGFQTLYSGSCQLSRQQDGYRSRFVAQLGNGATYSFVNRDGSYRIADNTGASWPVAYTDQGATGVFRWADLTMTVSQNGFNGGSSLGRSLGTLLESLFR